MPIAATQNLTRVITISLILFALRLSYIAFGPIDLAPDEAHYWEWSRQLDWSYYSKPPLVAWLIHLSTTVFGDTPVGVRFFSVVTLSVVTVLMFLIGRRVHSEQAGLIAALIFTVMPLFAAGGLLMTPDSPTLLFWAWAVYLLTGIDFTRQPDRAALKTFALIGLLVGMAGLAKYTAALFYPLLGLYLLTDRTRRVWLLAPHVYLAGIISLLCLIPVFYWNAMHGWISFQHVLGQAGGSSGFDGVKSIGNFLGGQLGVVTPVLFIMMIWVWLRIPKFHLSDPVKHHALHLLWWFSAPIFLGFLGQSLTAKVQPNWPVLAIWGGVLLLAIFAVMASRRFKSGLALGLMLSAVVTVIGHDTFILRKGLDVIGVSQPPFKNDPLKPVLGWRGLAHALDVLTFKVGGDKLIMTSRYQTAGQLAFYMAAQPEVLYVNPGYRRQNQYDLWSWPDLSGKIVLYIAEGKTPQLPAVIRSGFASCQYVGSVAAQRNEIVMRQAYMYACAGYRGIARPRPAVY